MLSFHEHLEKHGTSGGWTREEAAYLLLQLHDFYENRRDTHRISDMISACALSLALTAAESKDTPELALWIAPLLGAVIAETGSLVLGIDQELESKAHIQARFEFGERLFHRTTKVETPQEDVFIVSEGGYRDNLQIVRS